MKRISIFLAVLTAYLISPTARAAKEFPVQARLFAGLSTVDPKDVNEELRAESLDEIKKVYALGIEATYSAARFLGVGFRYTKRIAGVDESGSGGLYTNYGATLNQDSLMLLLRVPFVRNKFFFIDAFAGAGGTNTSLKIETASQNGELSKKEADDWYASTIYSYGASVGMGYSRFFISAEVGVETNKVDGLKATGSVNNHIQEIDLSGSYFMVSLIFDGVSASTK